MSYNGSTSTAFTMLGEVYRQEEAAKRKKRVNTHFADKFIEKREYTNVNGNKVNVGTKLIIRDMSDYSERHAIPNALKPISETTETIELPSIVERTLITTDMLAQKSANQPYGVVLSQRRVFLAVFQELFARMIDRIDRRRELSAIQALTKMQIEDNSSNKIIEYSKIPTHIMTPTHLWSDLAQSDPIADLEKICDIVYQDGTSNSFDIYMGKTAFTYFMNNEKVQKTLKIIDRGEVAPIVELENPNTIGVYSWKSFALRNGNTAHIKQYNEIYDNFNTDGKKTNSVSFFPDKEVLIIAKDAPLWQARGSTVVMDPSLNNGKYLRQKINGYDVTLEGSQEGLELIVRYCGLPIIPYHGSNATLKVVA